MGKAEVLLHLFILWHRNSISQCLTVVYCQASDWCAHIGRQRAKKAQPVCKLRARRSNLSFAPLRPFLSSYTDVSEVWPLPRLVALAVPILSQCSDAQQKSKYSFSVFRIIRFRISSECFRRFPIDFVDSIQVCPTEQSLISEISFGIWQARIADPAYPAG